MKKWAPIFYTQKEADDAGRMIYLLRELYRLGKMTANQVFDYLTGEKYARSSAYEMVEGWRQDFYPETPVLDIPHLD